MHLADAFIQSDLQSIQVIHFCIISTCVPWESNPQPFAQLTQWSTTVSTKTVSFQSVLRDLNYVLNTVQRSKILI